MKPPTWMTPPKPFRSLIGNLAITTSRHREGVLENVDEYVFGAGSFYKARFLQFFLENGISPLLSGRSKAVLTSGDDIELCLLMRMTGCTIYRSHRLRLQHYITKERLDWNYFQRLYVGFGYSDWITSFYTNFLENGKHELLNKSEIIQDTRRKQRSYRRYARLLRLLPFGQRFQKNKLFLLAKYEEGKLKFLEEEFQRIPAIQASIEAYYRSLTRF